MRHGQSVGETEERETVTSERDETQTERHFSDCAERKSHKLNVFTTVLANERMIGDYVSYIGS